MKKLNQFLNIVIGAFAGVFLGHGIYVVWNYQTNLELYAMQSAPWYTGILANGLLTLAVLMLCLGIKAMIKHKQNHSA